MGLRLTKDNFDKIIDCLKKNIRYTLLKLWKVKEDFQILT